MPTSIEIISDKIVKVNGRAITLPVRRIIQGIIFDCLIVIREKFGFSFGADLNDAEQVRNISAFDFFGKPVWRVAPALDGEILRPTSEYLHVAGEHGKLIGYTYSDLVYEINPRSGEVTKLPIEYRREWCYAYERPIGYKRVSFQHVKAVDYKTLNIGGKLVSFPSGISIVVEFKSMVVVTYHSSGTPDSEIYYRTIRAYDIKGNFLWTIALNHTTNPMEMGYSGAGVDEGKLVASGGDRFDYIVNEQDGSVTRWKEIR